MVEKEMNKEAEVKAVKEADKAAPVTEEKPKNLWQIAEVRMVAYVVPAALLVWLFSYVYQHIFQH